MAAQMFTTVTSLPNYGEKQLEYAFKFCFTSYNQTGIPIVFADGNVPENGRYTARVSFLQNGRWLTSNTSSSGRSRCVLGKKPHVQQSWATRRSCTHKPEGWIHSCKSVSSFNVNFKWISNLVRAMETALEQRFSDIIVRIDSKLVIDTVRIWKSLEI